MVDVVGDFRKHKLDIILILGLFLLAFGMRAIPHEVFSQQYGIYAFDSFYHARMTRTLLETGDIPDRDPLSYYPESKPFKSSYPPFYHYTLASIYRILAFANGVEGYDENFFIPINDFFVPVAGALGVVAMYVLGKELRDRKTGLFAGLILAGQQTHLFRTMFGFSEEDAFGITWMIASLAAYVWAFKKGTWKHGLVAGLIFAAFMLTWRMSVYISVLLAAFIATQILSFLINSQYRELKNMTEVYLASLIPIAVLGVLFNTKFDSFLITMALMLSPFILLLVALLAGGYLWKTDDLSKEKTLGIEKKHIYVGIVILFLIGGLGSFFIPKTETTTYGGWALSSVNGYFNAVIGTPAKLSQTVGEEHEPRAECNGVLQFREQAVLCQLGILMYPFLAALVWLPLRKILNHKDPSNMDMLIVIFLASTFVMYAGKVKLAYVFEPALAIALGIVFMDLFGAVKRLGQWPGHAALIIISVIVLGQVGIGMSYMEGMKNGYSPQPGWVKTMEWLKGVPDEDTAFLTWWDYGHWTAFMARKHAIVDNTNANQSKVIEVAKVFTEYRGNATEIEERVYPGLKKWKVTHMGVDRILLWNKWGALTFLADRQCLPTALVEAETGKSFPVLQQATQQMGLCGGGYGYIYCGDMGMAACTIQILSIPELGTDETVAVCNLFSGQPPVAIPMEQWKEMQNTPWPGYPLTVEGVGTLRVYATQDNKLMFFHARGTILPDAPINYMYAFRLFFRDPSLKYVKEMRNEYVPNTEVVVYEISYSSFEGG